MSARVLVAGGGIGGLTAALLLDRRGLDVTVFESVREPRELGVGINLLPHSVRILHDLGLGDRLDALAVRTSELRFLSEDGVLIWSEPRGLEAGNPWPQYSIHRGRLQVLLMDVVRERLGPDCLRTGRHLDGFTQDRRAVRARFAATRGGTAVEEVEGEVLVGADGLHSTVRAQLAPGEGPPVASGLTLWRGAAAAAPFLDGRTMFMAGSDRQKVVVYPIAPPDADGMVLTNWVAERPAVVDPSTADWNAPVDPASIAPWYADWDFGWLHVGRLIAGNDVAWEFPMVDREPLEHWSRGRVTLLGDAAHPMRPNGSNGASQAILDGEALADALAAGSDPEEALLAYEAGRRPATSELVLANRQAGPERVMQWVHDRCDGRCTDRHTCVPAGDLEREATAYKRLAGFDPTQLAARARDRGGEPR